MTGQPSLPSRMQCVEVDGAGGPEKLKLAERPLPQPQRGQVLIAVVAAGVNRADVAQRVGRYPPPPGASDLLGLEVSGTVVGLGEGVATTMLGSKVCALLPGGGYAQYAAVAASACLPIPDGLSVTDGAALPEAIMTVWHNVFERGALKAGETFLVHGGTSGIGTAAIQIAKSFGAIVATTAGTDEKCAACRKLGADLAINYRSADFVAEVRAHLPGKGVDVILDMVGGAYVSRNLAALKPEGRLVNIAFQEGSSISVDLMPVMLKRLTLTGSTLRARDDGFKAALATAVRAKVWPLLADRTIAPVVDCILPLSQAAEAHRRMESSAHVGKIILRASDN